MASNRCCTSFPCLADLERRYGLGEGAAWVMAHFIYAAPLFIFDDDFFARKPRYAALYLFTFIATLVQYFVISSSSPGYVDDARIAANEKSVIFRKASYSKQPASSENGGSVIDIDTTEGEGDLSGSDVTPWTKLVLELYPPGTPVWTFTCRYCFIEKPPRAKHCHDCDKCVLQFDHHCAFLGISIGQGNRCKYWWFLCGETASLLGTVTLYTMYLASNISRAWWKEAIMMLLLVILLVPSIFVLSLLLYQSYLILTNQTLYEFLRRKRIPYLRDNPERVHPFSKGVCSNLYILCCARSSKYTLEPWPTPT